MPETDLPAAAPASQVDYLIVGGGLAGATCAYLLKRAGRDVLLLERQDASRKAKLCAGLVTPRAENMLHRIFGTGCDALFQSSFDSMRCYVGAKQVDLSGISMKSVQRAELDAFALHAYLDAGGSLLDRFRMKDIDLTSKKIYGITADGEEVQIEFGTLIAADGALSTTRKLVTGTAPDSVLMLEMEIDHVGLPLIMDYNSRFMGYSWYAPVGDKAKLGCACYADDASATTLEEQLATFAERISVEYGKVKGAFCPTGKDVLLRQSCCYFLGDAAGLICPPSGEGIFYALYSAWQLAKALTSHASYEALIAGQLRQIRRQLKTRDLFFNHAFSTIALNAADMTPYGSERAVKFALRHFAGYEG